LRPVEKHLGKPVDEKEMDVSYINNWLVYLELPKGWEQSLPSIGRRIEIAGSRGGKELSEVRFGNAIGIVLHRTSQSETQNCENIEYRGVGEKGKLKNRIKGPEHTRCWRKSRSRGLSSQDVLKHNKGGKYEGAVGTSKKRTRRVQT